MNFATKRTNFIIFTVNLLLVTCFMQFKGIKGSPLVCKAKSKTLENLTSISAAYFLVSVNWSTLHFFCSSLFPSGFKQLGLSLELQL